MKDLPNHLFILACIRIEDNKYEDNQYFTMYKTNL